MAEFKLVGDNNTTAILQPATTSTFVLGGLAYGPQGLQGPTGATGPTGPATVDASLLTTGTLPAGRLPALTGDVTSSAGSAATAIASNVIVNADVNTAANIDATKLGTGIVNNTEFNYLDGVTSSIQTQFGTKLDSTSPTLAQTASPTYARGKLVYDTSNESLTFYNNDSNVSLQIGQEEWIRVMNNTGVSIPNGSAVYLNGSSAGVPTIALALASAAATTIGAGLATETIANGAVGYVCCLGNVNGIDTSAFTAGQTVYISSTTAGALTATAPVSPNYRYRIGIVGVSSASVGTIHVTPSTAALGNGSANQLLGINTAGTAQEFKTLTAGANITITPSAGALTIASTGGGGGGTWGSITGTLSSQTDLQTALDARVLKAGDTMTGALALTNGGLNEAGIVAGTTKGVYIGVVTGDTARIVFQPGTAGSSWEIDNSAGTFRWYKAGTTYLTMDTSNLTSSNNIVPNTTNTRNFGNSSLYWASLYATTLNLNSTASLSGATAGQISASGTVNIAPASGNDALVLNAVTLQTVIQRWQIASTERGAIYTAGGSTDFNVRSANDLVLLSQTTNPMKWNTTGLGLNTSPTHTLTLPSTSTGIALYNTSDQTTNYERVTMGWNTNVFQIATNIAGTGTPRMLTIRSAGSSSAREFRTQATATTIPQFQFVTTAAMGLAGSVFASVEPNTNATSGIAIGLQVLPTISQTSTAGYTALLVNPTITTTGSGTQLLTDWQVGGTSLSRVYSTGTVLAQNTALTPASVTAATTLTQASAGLSLCNATTAAFTITLPNATALVGQTFTIKKVDASANIVTVATGGGNIDATATYSLGAQYKYLTVVSNGTQWFITGNN